MRFIAIVLLLGLSSSSCVDPCGNTVLSQAYSPDRGLKAIVFERDCGATTDFSTHVSILTADEQFVTAGALLQSTRSGNVFVADTNHGEAPSGPKGGPVVRVEWLSPIRLRIAHDKRARVFARQAKLNGVDIVYFAEDPLHETSGARPVQ